MPLKLCILPLGLFAPVALFWAAAGVTFSEGKKRHGAINKFILWGVGLVVEVILHILMEYTDWKRTLRHPKEPAITHDVPPHPELLKAPPQSYSPPAQRNKAWPQPHSNINLRERLEAITTIILGEVGHLLESWKPRLDNIYRA